MPQFLNTNDADFEARFRALLAMKREDWELANKVFRPLLLQKYDEEAVVRAIMAIRLHDLSLGHAGVREVTAGGQFQLV